MLRKAARVYKRPLAVFYLSEVPKDFDVLRDFRRLPRHIPKDYSPELRLLVRMSRERLESIRELREERGETPLDFVGSMKRSEGARRVASEARSLLGVDVEQQSSWQGNREALNGWIDAFEGLGGFVFQSSEVALDEMRGFAIAEPIAALIVINAKDAYAGRAFTVIHEFCHILLGEGGISNLRLPRTVRSDEDEIEVFCNAVAAEVLVPAREFRSRFLALCHREGPDETIDAASRFFSVSREVIARRLLDLSLLSKSAYEERRQQYLQDFKRSQERQTGFAPTYRVVLRNNGRAFTKLVLAGYGDQLISARDVSGLLNVRLKHLATLEHELFPFRMVGEG